MPDLALRDALSVIASDAIPETTDLWPAIGRELAGRVRPATRPRAWRRVALGAVAVLVVVVAWTFVGPSSGQMSTVQAADLARSDPQVAAILRGDVAIVTVTQVVDDVAMVAVQDSHGHQVTVMVDLTRRVATSVYQGPQLSPALTTQALGIVRADPRTSALLARGATIGRIMPIEVSYERIDPATGKTIPGNETWAQVPLELGGEEWVARVDLPQARLDQVIDPHGAEVPLP